jgi:hypothetical protein
LAACGGFFEKEEAAAGDLEQLSPWCKGAFPQGLKPDSSLLASCGAAEAAPFQNRSTPMGDLL